MPSTPALASQVLGLQAWLDFTFFFSSLFSFFCFKIRLDFTFLVKINLSIFTYLYECIGASTCHSTYVEVVGGQLKGVSPLHTDHQVWWQVLLPIEPSVSLALELTLVGETGRYSLVVKNTCCGARSLVFLALPFPFGSALHSRTQFHVEYCLCLVSSCLPPPPHLQPGLRWYHLSLPSKKLGCWVYRYSCCTWPRAVLYWNFQVEELSARKLRHGSIDI